MQIICKFQPYPVYIQLQIILLQGGFACVKIAVVVANIRSSFSDFSFWYSDFSGT
jgi:hypothetical protein